MLNKRRNILKLIGLGVSVSLVGCKEKSSPMTSGQLLMKLKLHNFVGIQVLHSINKSNKKVDLTNTRSFFEIYNVGMWSQGKKKINGKIKKMIKQNFINGETVNFDGYLFAETEVSLYKSINIEQPELLEKFNK